MIRTLVVSPSNHERRDRPSTVHGRAVLAFVALLSASCAAPLMKLPTGPGTSPPREEGAAAFAQATERCSTIRTLTAEIAVGGRAAGRRLRGRMLAGVRAPDAARLEALAPFGAPIFMFVAQAGDATLLLPRENRVLERGQASAVLEAIAGVPLDGGDLEQMLTGCASGAPGGDVRRYGDTWQVVTDDADAVYLRRANAAQPWVVAAIVRRASARDRSWQAEFRDRRDGIPRAIRLTSLDASGSGQAFDLQLALSQVEIDGPLDADAFRIQVPSSADPMTLDELRRSGPLAPPGADAR